MQREFSHAKAARHMALIEHGVGGDPEAQAFRKDTSLIDSRFGHEDDEFIAAIARDHVRLPHLLVKQAADAGEDEVAFEVTKAVVDFLELVEIDDDQRKWAPGTHGALVFRLESL